MKLNWGEWQIYTVSILRLESEDDTAMDVADRLQGAMEEGNEVIVIRCETVGNFLKKWIGYGNTVAQISSFMSVASLVIGSLEYRNLSLAFTLGGLALRGLHGFMWERDLLCNYILYPNENIPPSIEPKTSEAILFRKPKARFFSMKNAITGCAVAVGAYFFWKMI